jgi:hypothetical protein
VDITRQEPWLVVARAHVCQIDLLRRDSIVGLLGVIASALVAAIGSGTPCLAWCWIVSIGLLV